MMVQIFFHMETYGMINLPGEIMTMFRYVTIILSSRGIETLVKFQVKKNNETYSFFKIDKLCPSKLNQSDNNFLGPFYTILNTSTYSEVKCKLLGSFMHILNSLALYILSRLLHDRRSTITPKSYS